MRLSLEETLELMRLAQERMQWIDKVEVFSGNEEFMTKAQLLSVQLENIFKRMGALWVRKSGILDQIEDHVAQGGGFDLRLLLNDQIGVLMEERQEVLDNVKGLLDQCEQMQNLIVNL